MAVVVRDHFEPDPEQPGPPSPGGLGGDGPCVVIALGKDEKLYELRRAGTSGCYTLSRAGRVYEVSLGAGGAWSCSCPSAYFRRLVPCKHVAAVALLRDLFQGSAPPEAESATPEPQPPQPVRRLL
jgi:hypothetical protein